MQHLDTVCNICYQVNNSLVTLPGWTLLVVWPVFCRIVINGVLRFSDLNMNEYK